MEIKKFWFRILWRSSLVATLLLYSTDARKSMLVSNHESSPTMNQPNVKHSRILDFAKSLNMVMDVSLKDSTSPQPYGVSSPFTLPPYDSLSPIPLPNPNHPPYCVYPPPPPSSTPTATPRPPPLQPPSPAGAQPSPPESGPSPSGSAPTPPYYEPSPPSSGNVPGPSPPEIYTPSPPAGLGGFAPSPPEIYIPSPPVGFAPSPPVFQPPVVFPPPTVPPARGVGGGERAWCVAKPTVPDPIIQEAMNYACGSGADCDPIRPNGSCYQPNTLLAHASYAFNSYWQRTKVAGGTCDFGGVGMLVTVDPSSGGCHFVSY